MPLTKEQKKEIIEDLRKKISRQKAIVFVAIENLKAEELFELRKSLKKENCLLAVVKKTLANKVFKENKIDCDAKEMDGQLALVFGFKEEILPAKISYKFSQSLESQGNKLKILGGLFENKFITEKEVIQLAKIPSREELLSKAIGSLKSPIVNFVNILQGNIQGLINVLAKVKT